MGGNIKRLLFAAAAGLALLSASCASGYWRVERMNHLDGGNANASTMMGFASPLVGIAISGSDLLVSENGGADWRIEHVAALPCLQGLDLVDDKTFIADCSCSAARISRDRGVTWSPLGVEQCQLFGFHDASAGWASNKIDLFSWDGRKTLLVEPPQEFMFVSAVAGVSAEKAYFMDNEGRVGKTVDRGASWTALAAGLTKDDFIIEPKCVAMRFADADRGLIVAYHKITKEWKGFSTEDGGRTWIVRTVSGAGTGPCFISTDLSLVTILDEVKNTLVLVTAHPQT